MTEQRFTNDRVRDMIRRAAELDLQEADSISESDLRQVAAEVGVSTASLDRALTELRGEIRAIPPRMTPAGRRWIPLTAVMILGVTGFLLAPQSSSELTVPFAVLVLLSGFAALGPTYLRRRRESMVLGLHGVRYLTASGERRLPWSSVVEVKSGIPGAVQLIGPSGSVLVVLKDFGDPDAVLAALKLRIARASLGQLPLSPPSAG